MKKYGIGLAVVVIAAAAFWLYGTTSEQAVQPLMAKATKSAFAVTVTSTGELRAQSSIDIQGPPLSTVQLYENIPITDLVAEGTVVKAGDYVATIDQTPLLNRIKDAGAAVQKAEAQFTQVKLDTTLELANARDELQNLKYALEERSIAVEQSRFEAASVLRQAELELAKAKRSLQQAEVNYKTKEKKAAARMREVEAELSVVQNQLAQYNTVLGQFRVMAPADGMVIYKREWNGKKKVVGSTIAPWNLDVAELPDLRSMECITYINEVDIQKISKGQKTTVKLDAYPDKQLQGTVTAVANVGEQRPNSTSKVFEVIIKIQNADTTLRPGMTTSNEIIVQQLPPSVTIPLEALFPEGDEVFVYKKSGGKIIKHEVKITAVNETLAAIEQGVTEGDELFLTLPKAEEVSDTKKLNKKNVSMQAVEPRTIAQQNRQNTIR